MSQLCVSTLLGSFGLDNVTYYRPMIHDTESLFDVLILMSIGDFPASHVSLPDCFSAEHKRCHHWPWRRGYCHLGAHLQLIMAGKTWNLCHFDKGRVWWHQDFDDDDDDDDDVVAVVVVVPSILLENSAEKIALKYALFPPRFSQCFFALLRCGFPIVSDLFGVFPHNCNFMRLKNYTRFTFFFLR